MRMHKIIVVLAFLVLLAASLGAWSYYSVLRKASIAEDQNSARARVEARVNSMTAYLSEYQQVAATLAGLPELPKSLSKKDGPALSQANVILDDFQSRLHLEVCYLMDSAGNIIASSNRNTPENFVGKNYFYRPYFKQAISGDPAIYLAVGAPTGKRGVYYSHPVYLPGGNKPVGVVAIKVSVEFAEKALKNSNNGIMLFTSPQGIVFVSSRDDWLFHVLWKTASAELSGLAESRQFTEGPFEWTGVKKIGEGLATDKDGNKYALYEKELDNLPGWKVVYLHDLGNASHRMLSILASKDFSKVIIVFFVITGLSSVYLYRTANREIMKREKAEEALKESEKKCRNIFENVIDVFYQADADGNFQDISPSVLRYLGYSREELIGKPVTNMYADPQDRLKFLEAMQESGEVVDYEVRVKAKNGQLLYVSVFAHFVYDSSGKKTGVEGTFRDITERKHTAEELKRLNELLVRRATTDHLTGISNRLKFSEALDSEIKRSRRYDIPLSLVMFDIDHFKRINDTYGHQAGDRVLCELAELIVKIVRANDLFARWGGEEFMVLTTETSGESARILAEKLREIVDKNEFSGVGHVTCSFGVVQLDRDDNIEQFTRRADQALYRAKTLGRNRVEKDIESAKSAHQ
jgi:diguanylate cyclase (GGDEF)-like protein/PAS domain S-box-containing protein